MARILIVEDSSTQAEELRLILQAEGFETTEVSDGVAALECLKTASFDVILTDILMPGISGYQLCRYIKNDPVHNLTPVVLVTVLKDPADIVMGLECGADNYIIKPIDRPGFASRIRQLLDTKDMRAANPQENGIDIILKGKKFTVDADRQTVLDFLISAFDDFSIAKQRQYESQLEEARRAFQAEASRAREILFRKQKEQLQQLIHAAAHDLQEPLRAVVSYTELLKQRYKERLDQDADGFIAFAVEGAHRMKELIGDLAAFAQVHAESRDFALTDCSVVLEQVLARLGPAIQQSQAVVLRDPLPTVLADGAQLARVFEELIDNALKFKGYEPPRIHVSAQKKEREWVFAVRDNGIGIETRDTERVFAIFKRLHSKEKYTGTGAGLAICARIVENHGGRLWVDSELGKGSTFFFTIAVQPPA